MADLIDPLLPGVAARARARGTKLHADVSPALLHVRVDPRLTHEALALLLDAALTAAGENGLLHLTATREQGCVRIELAHPPGAIAPARLAVLVRLFDLQGIVLTSHPGRSTFTLPRASPSAHASG